MVEFTKNGNKKGKTMARKICVYVKDEQESKAIKVFLAIYRSGLSDEVIQKTCETAIKVAKEQTEKTKEKEIGIFGEILPAGWHVRDLGPLGRMNESPDGKLVHVDGSGAITEYRAACIAENLPLDKIPLPE